MHPLFQNDACRTTSVTAYDREGLKRAQSKLSGRIEKDGAGAHGYAHLADGVGYKQDPDDYKIDSSQDKSFCAYPQHQSWRTDHKLTELGNTWSHTGVDEHATRFVERELSS